jgi:hypothetical protein
MATGIAPSILECILECQEVAQEISINWKIYFQTAPNGWPAVLDDTNRFKVAKALGLWSAHIPDSYEKRVDQVGDALLAHPPPPGWRPLGPDDKLLLSLLPDEEV